LIYFDTGIKENLEKKNGEIYIIRNSEYDSSIIIRYIKSRIIIWAELVA
jgi:hypothetical protein